MGLCDIFQDEPKLKKWTLYLLIACLVVSIVMIIWYIIRYNKSGTNESISGIFSIIHVVGYICFGVVTGLALVGTYCTKSQYLLWYLFGCLGCIGGELFCLLWNFFISKEGKHYSIVLQLVKIVIIIFVMVCAVFVFLLKRLRAKQAVNPNETEKALETPPEKKPDLAAHKPATTKK